VKLKRPSGWWPKGPVPDVSPTARACQPRVGLCGPAVGLTAAPT
jgi:hypothetical protein